jgi:hypothetical protein
MSKRNKRLNFRQVATLLGRWLLQQRNMRRLYLPPCSDVPPADFGSEVTRPREMPTRGDDG